VTCSEVGVPAGGDPARFQGHARAAVQLEALAQDHVGAGQRAGRIADPLGEARGHVAAAGVRARPVGADRVVQRGHRGQGLVLDAQRFQRVLGLGGALGQH
jgi:hypothetical protein